MILLWLSAVTAYCGWNIVSSGPTRRTRQPLPVTEEEELDRV